MSAPPPRTLPATFDAIGTFSRGIARSDAVRTLLGAEHVELHPNAQSARRLAAVVGWGEKPNTARARSYAERHRIPYLRLEDGFLRSVGLGLGVRGEPPLSIVVDDEGIYYDSRGPSRLERLIAHSDDPTLVSPALLVRAERAMDRIRAARLSKYNDAPPDAPLPRLTRAQRVLVVDQTFGDRSVELGRASPALFHAMLQAALSEHPDADILVKTHPDVITGRRRGYLDRLSPHPRVQLVANKMSPLCLLEAMTHVYVATSQLGFEALLLGKAVTVFGAPFYAGWGLTDDRLHVARRAKPRSLAQVFAAAYLLYPRYLHPERGERGEIEDVLAHLELQRALFAQNCGDIFCVGFGFWKRRYVRAYLKSPENRVSFVRSARAAERQGFDARSRLLVWGHREPPALRALAARAGVSIERMEDGFLRSVGLGSDFVAPSSLVVDRRGIYYDPRQPSDLETLLQNASFSDEERARAERLIAAIIAGQLTKYNFSGGVPIARPPLARPVLLVPGQVEDDASIRHGCLDVRTNLGLLEAVRAARPEAYVLFKPHPDVLVQNRRGHVPEAEARRFADEVASAGPLPRYLAIVDEVHTMTSLVGFEALLRGLPVSTYGQPFYAGWGLTSDRHPHPRRSRRLSLPELVAGTLLRYPRYLSQRTRRFTSPEQVIVELEAQLTQSRRALEAPWLWRQLTKGMHILRGLRDFP